MPGCQLRHLFGERLLGALGVVAEQPPYSQPDQHFLTCGGGVGQMAVVAAVRPARRDPTAWARRWRLAGARLDAHHTTRRPHRFDPHLAQVRPENPNQIKINTRYQ